jgi:hypothetical protein
MDAFAVGLILYELITRKDFRANVILSGDKHVPNFAFFKDEIEFPEMWVGLLTLLTQDSDVLRGSALDALEVRTLPLRLLPVIVS